MCLSKKKLILGIVRKHKFLFFINYKILKIVWKAQSISSYSSHRLNQWKISKSLTLLFKERRCHDTAKSCHPVSVLPLPYSKLQYKAFCLERSVLVGNFQEKTINLNYQVELSTWKNYQFHSLSQMQIRATRRYPNTHSQENNEKPINWAKPSEAALGMVINRVCMRFAEALCVRERVEATHNSSREGRDRWGQHTHAGCGHFLSHVYTPPAHTSSCAFQKPSMEWRTHCRKTCTMRYLNSPLWFICNG